MDKGPQWGRGGWVAKVRQGHTHTTAASEESSQGLGGGTSKRYRFCHWPDDAQGSWGSEDAWHPGLALEARDC